MDETSGRKIEVTIVYALRHEQIVETLQVPVGTTVGQAIEDSEILRRFPETPSCFAVGIFGRRTETTAVLHEFDRIEIYRPLIADPKQARRSRARKGEKRTS
ncbi:MAG: hypothetical protein JWN94_2129 [Betaproteobacteria bacterium]|nr:hypothetical protein [Betaproteobacteria bacterium]